MSEKPEDKPVPYHITAPNYKQADTTLLGEEHIRVYRETNGEQGYIWNGSPILLMTSIGRVSKEPRTIAIIYTQVGDDYVIIASKGGSPVHPKWYLNLLDNPNVEIQIKAEKFKAVARTAESPEREKIWAECIKNWPNYDTYQARTERKIPVVVISRVK